MVAAIATVALVALDLGTKQWAVDELSFRRPGPARPVCAPDEDGFRMTQRVPLEDVVVIDDYLRLHYAENCGAAFGLLRQAPSFLRHAVFGLAALAASIVLSLMFWQGRGGALFAWSVPLIVSGAVGNLIDRARLGYVVDFIRFHIEDPALQGTFLYGFEWPTFNVADCGITIGVALLVLDGFRENRATETHPEAGGGNDGSGGGDGAGGARGSGGASSTSSSPASAAAE